jgi:MFS family permease
VRKELDRRIWLLAVARTVNTAGLSLVLAFLGVYVVEDRGYPAMAYGAIALVANLAQSMSNAWAGALSDRVGRRPLITWSLLVRGAAIAVLGTLVLLDAPLLPIAAFIVLSSMLRGCFEPVAYALVADVVAPEQRITAFGLQRMGTNLGWALGPAVGGTLSLIVPYGVIFYVAAAALCVASFITRSIADPVQVSRPPPGSDAPIAEPVPPLRRRVAEALAIPELRLMIGGTFLAAMLQTQMFSTLAIFMTDHVGVTKAEVGLLYTVNGGLVLLLQVPAMALIRRRGTRLILPWAALLSTVGFAMIAIGSFRGAVLAIFVITCAEMLFDPAHQTNIAELSSPSARGRMFGVLGFAQMVGIAFAPLLGGTLLDTIGSDHLALWLTLALLGLGETWCFVRFARFHRGPVTTAPVTADRS